MEDYFKKIEPAYMVCNHNNNPHKENACLCLYIWLYVKVQKKIWCIFDTYSSKIFFILLSHNF